MKTLSRFLLYMNFCAFLMLFCVSSEIFAQNPKPAFKILERSRPANCKGKGTLFVAGYLNSPKAGNVIISLFFQHKSGYWEKKQIIKSNSGKVELNIGDCDYTGNVYTFAHYEDDKTFKVPSELEIENSHNAKDQTPKFKPSDPVKSKCTDGTGAQMITFTDGSVLSPKGTRVEITFFVENKEGKWRKKHFLYDGTGKVDLNISGCDLTGNYKVLIDYIQE